MSQIDLSKYKGLYIKTAREYVDQLATGIENFADGKNDSELINTLHIASHSLKGQSLTMGYSSIANISLTLEHIFADAKSNLSILTPELIAVARNAVAQMSESISFIEQGNSEKELSEIIAALQKLHPQT